MKFLAGLILFIAIAIQAIAGSNPAQQAAAASQAARAGNGGPGIWCDYDWECGPYCPPHTIPKCINHQCVCY